MNNGKLLFAIVFIILILFFALTREYWQALAKYVFFALIAGIALRPLGLYIGNFLRRMIEKKEKNL